MAHQRKLIRDAVVALLVGANTAAGARVKATRVEPNESSELPALSVYTLSEEVSPDSAQTAPIELTRILNLEITGWVINSAAVSVDDAMDAIAEQIEAAMASDYYIGSTVVDQMLSKTEMQVLADNGSDPLIGVITLTYEVTYRTSPAETGATPVDNFNTFDAKFPLSGSIANDTPVDEDTVTVQEPAP